ncbi:UNVERIFIED_ORG: hypothetical protein L601_007400000050, partial [Gordonia westfalica J30]
MLRWCSKSADIALIARDTKVRDTRSLLITKALL